MLLNYYPLSLLQTLTLAICLYGFRYTYWQFTTGARRRRLAASRGWNEYGEFESVGIHVSFSQYVKLGKNANVDVKVFRIIHCRCSSEKRYHLIWKFLLW